MKKIINWFRDLLYNLTDYAIIICVIAAVAVILIWRFNILFDIKIDKNAIPPIEISDNADKNDSKDTNSADDSNSTDSTDSTADSNTNTPTEPDSSKDSNTDSDINNNQDDNSTNTATGSDIKFTVPSGSFPSKIADILVANGLIEDKKIFLTRCVELELDTKLKSGDFTIKKGTALDDIIKIIAK